MKFTDEQKDLLAFLPKALKNSKELTDSSKLVLGNIIFLYGMEDAQKNGYVYRTNSKMMEETDIKSEHTLIGAVRLLELLGYIETKRGKRKEASTYKLLINCSETPQNCSNNCSEIEILQNQVLILQKQMVLLQKEIENLKNCSKKCSTDTETDIEIDNNIKLEYNNNKNNFSTSTGMDMYCNEKEKNNKKEKIDTDTECNNSNMSCNDELLDLVFSSGSGTSSNDGQVINDLKVINMEGNKLKKENAMSDNGAIGMNVEESEMKWNAQHTSLATSFEDALDTTSMGFDNNSKLQDKCSIFKEDCPKTLPNPNPFPSLNDEISQAERETCFSNSTITKSCKGFDTSFDYKWEYANSTKGTGATKIIPMCSYATQEDRTQPEAQECPQIEFNYREWCEVMNKLMEYTPKVDDIDEFKTLLKKIDGMMQDLKGKVSQRQYNYNCKNITAWFNSNSFDQDFDKICLAGDLKRKYNYN